MSRKLSGALLHRGPSHSVAAPSDGGVSVCVCVTCLELWQQHGEGKEAAASRGPSQQQGVDSTACEHLRQAGGCPVLLARAPISSLVDAAISSDQSQSGPSPGPVLMTLQCPSDCALCALADAKAGSGIGGVEGAVGGCPRQRGAPSSLSPQWQQLLLASEAARSSPAALTTRGGCVEAPARLCRLVTRISARYYRSITASIGSSSSSAEGSSSPFIALAVAPACTPRLAVAMVAERQLEGAISAEALGSSEQDLLFYGIHTDVSLQQLESGPSPLSVQQLLPLCLEDIHRQDWSSNSAYRRGRRVTSGVLAAAGTLLLLDSRRPPGLLPTGFSEFCISLLTSYGSCHPSRARSGQVNADLTLLLAAMLVAMKNAPRDDTGVDSAILLALFLFLRSAPAPHVLDVLRTAPLINVAAMASSSEPTGAGMEEGDEGGAVGKLGMGIDHRSLLDAAFMAQVDGSAPLPDEQASPLGMVSTVGFLAQGASCLANIAVEWSDKCAVSHSCVHDALTSQSSAVFVAAISYYSPLWVLALRSRLELAGPAEAGYPPLSPEQRQHRAALEEFLASNSV